MRQPIIQVTERPAATRGVRDLSQKRDMSGRDCFGRQQQGKKRVAGRQEAEADADHDARRAQARGRDGRHHRGLRAGQEDGRQGDRRLKKLWAHGHDGRQHQPGHRPRHRDDDRQRVRLRGRVDGVQRGRGPRERDARTTPRTWSPRAPVVTIMGHVDHGKTSLLDAIRKANVAAGEAGGITQHIGAYKVRRRAAATIVFLDTPGHEAFTAMRARGAKVTDIVVLVVAADDGVMPQTDRGDQPRQGGQGADHRRHQQDRQAGRQPGPRSASKLAEHGLVPEEWGGDTIFVERLGARPRQGIDKLLEMLVLQAEVLELKANPNKPAKGTVIEARLDRGRGPVATVLVQEGTLQARRHLVAGEHFGQGPRHARTTRGSTVTEAGPVDAGRGARPRRRARRRRDRSTSSADEKAGQGAGRAPPRRSAARRSWPGTGQASRSRTSSRRSRRARSRSSRSSSRPTCRARSRRSPSALTQALDRRGEGQRHPRRRRRHHRDRRQPGQASQGHHRRLQRAPGRQGRSSSPSRRASTSGSTTSSTRRSTT